LVAGRFGAIGAGANVRERGSRFVWWCAMNDDGIVKAINIAAICLMACMGFII
jgi:hypothetical protein